MMMSDRPNRPRGNMRFRNPPERTVSGDTVWDKDISYASHGLQVEWQFGVFFDLPAQTRDLHIDGPFKRDAEPRAQIAARKRAAGVGGEQLKQGSLGACQFHRLALAAE